MILSDKIADEGMNVGVGVDGEEGVVWAVAEIHADGRN